MHDACDNGDGAAGDRLLVERATTGDDSAYGLLVERYQKPVLNLVYRLTGSATDAQDIAQDVFVRAHRALGAFNFRAGSDSFRIWLFRIARNAVTDSFRRRGRRPETLLSPDEISDAAGPAGGDPRAAAAAADEGELVARAVAMLPEDQRTAVVLSEYHDLPHAEIADIMECSVKSVESRLYRARAFLRQELAGKR